MLPWVSVPTIHSLSPNTFFVLGERARVRGQGRAHSCKSWFEPTNTLETNSTRLSPIDNKPPPSPGAPAPRLLG